MCIEYCKTLYSVDTKLDATAQTQALELRFRCYDLNRVPLSAYALEKCHSSFPADPIGCLSEAKVDVDEFEYCSLIYDSQISAAIELSDDDKDSI